MNLVREQSKIYVYGCVFLLDPTIGFEIVLLVELLRDALTGKARDSFRTKFDNGHERGQGQTLRSQNP